MNKQKKIKTFVISTKGIFGSRRILQHVKNNIDGMDVDKKDKEKILDNLKCQIINK